MSAEPEQEADDRWSDGERCVGGIWCEDLAAYMRRAFLPAVRYQLNTPFEQQITDYIEDAKRLDSDE